MSDILTGDSLEVLKQFPDNHFDSMITDPPYGLSFMGKKWDYNVPSVELWKEALRVLKPGAFILVACGTRTQHRMVVNIEDAGFEIRDVISWIYGSGFPKSLNISKAIDSAAGAEREKTPTGNTVPDMRSGNYEGSSGKERLIEYTESPTTEAAKKWEGFGTAIKPAQELWTLARKPPEGTIAQNVQKYSVGGLNIDASRIEFQSDSDKNGATWGRGTDIIGGNYVGATHSSGKENIEANPQGRFPSNVIFDEFTAKLLDEQTGNLKSGAMKKSYVYQNNGFSLGKPSGFTNHICESNEGGASRFFYCAKASQEERNRGLENFETVTVAAGNQAKAELKRGNEDFKSDSESATSWNKVQHVKNHYPTVKPVALMSYLVKLITPPGGLVLDPFAGSGTTGCACELEKLPYVLIDREKDYTNISKARTKAFIPPTETQLDLF